MGKWLANKTLEKKEENEADEAWGEEFELSETKMRRYEKKGDGDV